MQTNVRATIAKCYDEGMDQANTVAYVLINHCCGELPPFRTKQKVAEFTAKYYDLRAQDKV